MTNTKSKLQSRFYDRMQQLEEGDEPFCPAVYKVWARGLHGFAVAAEFEPKSL